jgi:hypothetical protein
MRTLTLIALVLAAGCTNKLEGDVQLDGASFTATSCRSGVAFGFAGVELHDGGGRRIRVINDPITGTVRVALFAGAAGRGEDLGTCAALDQRPQSSTVNGLQNQEGTVSFHCDTGPHKLSGNLTFKNCH